jgi:hypothetical protein
MSRRRTETWYLEWPWCIVYITLPSAATWSCHHPSPTPSTLRLVSEKTNYCVVSSLPTRPGSCIPSIIAVTMSLHQSVAATLLLLEIVCISVLCTQIHSDSSPRLSSTQWALQSTGFTFTLFARYPDRNIMPYLDSLWPSRTRSEVFLPKRFSAFMRSTATSFVQGQTMFQ